MQAYQRLRPIRPEDEPQVVRFHHTLSEISVYMRYFHWMKLEQRTAHERLTRICFIDYDRQMADLARRRLREKIPQLREALSGKVTDHHRFMLRQLMDQMRHLEGQVETFDARIEQVMRPLEKAAVQMLDQIPGFDVERDVVERFRAVDAIAESDVLERKVATDGRQ